jgi:hypothetical protein
MLPPPLLNQITHPPATSTSILNIHISSYIKFEVIFASANFSKWRLILLFLLRMYRVLDHITEGAAPTDPDESRLAVEIHISLWFMGTLSDDLHRLVCNIDDRACTT